MSEKSDNKEQREIDPDILRRFSEQDFLAERVRHLYQHTAVALVWTALLALVVLFNVYTPGTTDNLVGPIWAGTILLLCLVMATITFTFKKAAPKVAKKSTKKAAAKAAVKKTSVKKKAAPKKAPTKKKAVKKAAPKKISKKTTKAPSPKKKKK